MIVAPLPLYAACLFFGMACGALVVPGRRRPDRSALFVCVSMVFLLIALLSLPRSGASMVSAPPLPREGVSVMCLLCGVAGLFARVFPVYAGMPIFLAAGLFVVLDVACHEALPPVPAEAAPIHEEAPPVPAEVAPSKDAPSGGSLGTSSRWALRLRGDNDILGNRARLELLPPSGSPPVFFIEASSLPPADRAVFVLEGFTLERAPVLAVPGGAPRWLMLSIREATSGRTVWERPTRGLWRLALLLFPGQRHPYTVHARIAAAGIPVKLAAGSADNEVP